MDWYKCKYRVKRNDMNAFFYITLHFRVMFLLDQLQEKSS